MPKELTEYYRSSRNLDGHFNECKLCSNARGREYRKRPDVIARDKGKRKEYHDNYRCQTLYGISIEQKRAMRVEQQDACAICGQRFLNDKDCNVDHNHETKKVRQLLCTRCNHFLAAVEDKRFLAAAQNYLKKHEGEQ